MLRTADKRIKQVIRTALQIQGKYLELKRLDYRCGQRNCTERAVGLLSLLMNPLAFWRGYVPVLI